MFKHFLIMIFGAPSVDKALAKFNKALADLQATAEHHDLKAAAHREAAAVAAEAEAAAHALAAVAMHEASRAREVGERLKAIFG